MQRFIREIESKLLPELVIASEQQHEPVRVHRVPAPWKTLGVGNYAAVLVHPDQPDLVVKVYAPGRPGIEEEAEVYRRLGRHPAYSECLHAGAGYLVLRRLTGITLYQCLLRGIPIPRQVIMDIDLALGYARSVGLNPHDVHGKNVMLQNGRGKVVDVSDFLKQEPCLMWDDLKRAYGRFYRPWLSRLRMPEPLLDTVRRGYRIWRKRRSR
nr:MULTISPECIES: serine/threonine protein kinase [unclassified Paenibacillus]